MQDQTDTEFEVKSKTQRKKDTLELTELGRALAQLKPEELAQIPLDDELLAAIKESRKITQNAARKRHFQFIGKLMRKTNSQAIVAAHQQLLDKHNNAARRLHAVENWRDQLLSGDSDIFQSFVEQHPAADRQQIRALVRAAAKEAQQGKAPASARKLFKLVRDTLSIDDSLTIDR